MLTLHVTNGDVAAQGLARSGLPGDVLAWRDVLHDGPVPHDGDLRAFRQARAMFLADRGWASEVEVLEDLVARDERFAGLCQADAIMLWFEPDLYDQLQLMQVLARLAARPASERPTVSIAPADLMLGSLAPEKFLPLYASRRRIVDADFEHGAASWNAYTADTPDAMGALVARLDTEIAARRYATDDDVRLPHLTTALRRVLEEYPDVDNGLSRSERQICEALAPGPITMSKLYEASHKTSESWVWLSDWSFAWYVQRLSEVARPLITHPNGTCVIAPRDGLDPARFWAQSVLLTPFGNDVVRARADTVRANGLDRWIGGTHLTADLHWRWNARIQSTVRTFVDD